MGNIKYQKDIRFAIDQALDKITLKSYLSGLTHCIDVTKDNIAKDV